MRFVSLSAGLFVLLALGSCSTARTIDAELLTSRHPMHLSLEEGDGILVVETDSNSPIHALYLQSRDDPRVTVHLGEIGDARRIHFVVLPAGDYRWSRIELPGETYRGKHYPYIWDLDEAQEYWRLSVRAGVVSYPGVLVLRRYSTTYLTSYTVNRSGRFLSQILDKARWILDELEVAYTGWDRDDFLTVYSEQLASMRERADRRGHARVASDPGGEEAPNAP